MTKRRKRLLFALATVSAVIAATAAGVVAFVPSWLRGTVERVASHALGRDLRIAGPFAVSWSRTPTLTAGGITLSNAPWGSQPAMASAGRVTVSIELRSLWSRPVRVREVIVEDARVLLEADGEGRGNWMFDLASRAAPARPRPPGPAVVVEHAAIRGFELDYRRRPGAQPVVVGVEALEATLEQPTRMIALRGAGRFNEAPWEIAGSLGTFERILEGHEIDHTLTGRVGEAKLELRGHVRDPLTLGEPDVELSLDGPDIVAALGNFGLRSPLTGPFSLRGRFTPAKDGVAFDLTAGLGDTTAAARGVVGALLAPGRIDAQVNAAGRDASEIGAWTGVPGLPPRPFELAGRVRLEDRKVALENVAIRVGPTSATVSGVIGPPPRCVGTSLDVRGAGGNLAELSALTRLHLPEGPFAIRGRFLRREDGLALGPTEVRFKESVVAVEGAIGEPPRVPNLDLAVDASGPDLSVFSTLARVDLPPEAFVVRGRVARDGPAVVLHDVAGRLGTIGANLSGRLVPVKRLLGSDAEVHVAGPDLAKLASFAKLRGVPSEPFDAHGRVRIVDDGYQLDDVQATVGRVAAAVTGRIGSPSALDGTSLSCRAHGPALSDLAVWGLPAKLPADPFAVAGSLDILRREYRLRGAVAEVGDDRLRVDGTLGTLPDSSRLDVAVSASGPSVAALGRFVAAAGAKPPERLPAVAYEAAGRVRRIPEGYELEDLRMKAADTVLDVSGTLGTGRHLLGSDLRFEAGAPDASLLAELAGRAMPDGPFEARGHLARSEAGVLSDGVSVALGEARAEISGTLGAWPRLEGTDLEVRVSGSDLSATLGPPTGLESLPEAPFELSAHLEGSVDRFASDPLAARLGGSDLDGRVAMRLEGKPFLEADLRSGTLDLPELLAGFGGGPADPSQPAAPTTKRKRKSERKRERLIPDDPLPLAALGRLDATLRLTAERVALPGLPLRDVIVAGELHDRAVRVDRLEGTGANGGRASASLTLEPEGDGWRLRAQGRVDDGRLIFPKAAAIAEKAPTVDVEFALAGAGGSLHRIAASGEGQVLVIVGPGVVPNAAQELITSDVLKGLLDALNPFRKSSDHTDVECGIASAELTAGKAVVEPIALRTDNMTIVGRGKADFETEGIDLVWTLKPRQGVGLSAGSIANPYVKLGGTLLHPSLDVKPLQAAASTGAAVATAGLTILFKSIYNRITAEKKVCVDALEKARKRMEERSSREAPPEPVSPSP